MNQQEIKENQMREQVVTTSLTIKIPTHKYKVLLQLARQTGTESLTFFKGKVPFKCPTATESVPGAVCPVNGESEICKKYVADYVEAEYGDEISGVFCYGVFIKWLLSED